MKIYLQDCKTLKYIRCDSSWSPDINEALDFMSIRRATLYGFRELQDAFQLLQIETDGFQTRVSAMIGQLPVIKKVTVPRPVRATRAICVARDILKRTGLWRNRRPAGQIPWTGDIFQKAF